MRIFWFGMHKILIQTELPRLRELGYEVFCPAYINKSSQHQSASNGWTPDQKTTLPPDVFRRLSNYNFFYHQISAEIISLLNQHFDAVIVTIDPSWLIEILRGYKGKVLYRTYGHVEIMSNYLSKNNALQAITARNNFWYIPHSLECARHEHSWLRERMKVVPYCIADEILKIEEKWSPRLNEVMISCPNIANPYFRKHYEYLKKYFSDSRFKFYGVQTTEIPDPQVKGTIPYDELLTAYRESAGFLYTYREPTVCFLPPIEMMICGGPVIFLRGSLLDEYFPENAPGRAENETEALLKCERLLAQDADFTHRVIESQKHVRSRYLPRDVWPIFDQTFKEILNPSMTNFGSQHFLTSPLLNSNTVAIDAMVGTDEIAYDKGQYSASSSKSKWIQEVCSQYKSSQSVFLLTTKEQIQLLWGLIEDKKNIIFYLIDDDRSTYLPKILYPAEGQYGKFIYALCNPSWTFQKINSIFKMYRPKFLSKKSFKIPINAHSIQRWIFYDIASKQKIIQHGLDPDKIECINH